MIKYAVITFAYIMLTALLLTSLDMFPLWSRMVTAGVVGALYGAYVGRFVSRRENKR